MNRLDLKIKLLSKQNKKALVAFLTAGFPDLESDSEIVDTLVENGVDVLELGVPFSDPIADGPTIQASSQIALEKGINLRKILKFVKKLRKKHDIPILLMSYLNPIYHFGIENLAKQSNICGVDGFIIPDLIPGEAEEIERTLRQNGLSLVFLAAPNTPTERLRLIDSKSASFVYVVSIAGVTGKRKILSESIAKYLVNTRKNIKANKRFIGFGISSAKQVRQLKDFVDGVIVGSALIELIVKNKSIKQIGSFVKSLRIALDNASKPIVMPEIRNRASRGVDGKWIPDRQTVS